MKYRLTVTKEFIRFPQVWGHIINEGKSVVVDDDFVNRTEVVNLVKIGAVKIIPLGINYEFNNPERVTSKRRRRLLNVESNEEVQQISEIKKEGVD